MSKWQLFYLTSLSRTSSAGSCRRFTKSVPSVTVSSHSSSSLWNSSASLLPKSGRVFLLASSPCILACQATLVYLSCPVLVTCPGHLSCVDSVICLRGIIPNHFVIVWFLILSLFVSPSTFLKYVISVACNWRLCLEEKSHYSLPYVLLSVSFVFLTTSFFSTSFTGDNLRVNCVAWFTYALGRPAREWKGNVRTDLTQIQSETKMFHLTALSVAMIV